jgi:hypothetical protein
LGLQPDRTSGAEGVDQAPSLDDIELVEIIASPVTIDVQPV